MYSVGVFAKLLLTDESVGVGAPIVPMNYKDKNGSTLKVAQSLLTPAGWIQRIYELKFCLFYSSLELQGK